MLRHLPGKRTAHLDVVAKYAVVANFQRADTGFFLQLCLQRSKITLAAVHNLAQLVHLGMITCANDAAVFQQSGCVFVYGREDMLFHIRQRIDIRSQRIDLSALKRCQKRLYTRQPFARGRQSGNFPRGRRAIYYTRHQTLHIKNAVQCIHDLGAPGGILHKLLHGVEPRADLHHINKRLLDPASNQALAHRRFCFIQHPEQRALFLPAAHCLRKLQVGARNGRKLHILRFKIVLYGF